MRRFGVKAGFGVCVICVAASMASALAGCATVKNWVDETFSRDEAGISAKGSLGKKDAEPEKDPYTGDAGAGIRLAVLAPEAQGDVPPYLPIYVQGLLNNNFRKYSKMTLVDRQNLDKILADQTFAAGGAFSDKDYVTIGNITNAEFLLVGVIQRLGGDSVTLMLSVTGAASGVTRAYSMKSGSLEELEGSGAVINAISAELLAQLGVTLTERGKAELLAGDSQTAKAEAGLAMGITAQSGGSEVEALFNYTRAITFDPSQQETISRLSLLSTTISEGSISEKIVNDIVARGKWLDAFKEAASFYAKHPPFEISFDPNLVQVGVTDYKNNKADLGMHIALEPSSGGFAALNALLEGLDTTGRRQVWGFAGWPLLDISPKAAGTVVFDGKRSFSYDVKTVLLNDKNKVLGRGSVTLKTSVIEFAAGDSRVNAPLGAADTVIFPGVKAGDLTPTLTIVIESVNGISSRELNATDYMRIYTADLEAKAAQAAQARYVAERDAADLQAQADAAAAQAAQARKNAAALKKTEDEANSKAWWDRTLAKSKRGGFNLAAFIQFTRNDSFQSGPRPGPGKEENGMGKGAGFGLEYGGYFSFVPLTSAGIEVKGGLFNSRFMDIIAEDAPADETLNGWYANVSPVMGVVLPLSESVKLYADGLLEAGFFGEGLKGVISEYVTYGYDAGLILGPFNIKYRGTWYDKGYVHGIMLGIK
jgi:hypothetical protein